jgi:hypothetical protein
LPHTGQRATRDEVVATRVMAFSVARTLVRFSSLGAGSKVWQSGMSNLDHVLDLLGCQIAAPFHRKLGRTTEPGQVQRTLTSVLSSSSNYAAVSAYRIQRYK